MKINELTKRTGLTAPTIRFYEKEGLLDARHVCRSENNYRDYNEEAVEQLLTIKEVQAAGFTLAEYKEMEKFCQATDESFIPEAVVYVRRKIATVTEKITELENIQAYLNGKLAEMLQNDSDYVKILAKT
jgi:DNA-binding transcriptional MerR regulator